MVRLLLALAVLCGTASLAQARCPCDCADCTCGAGLCPCVCKDCTCPKSLNVAPPKAVKSAECPTCPRGAVCPRPTRSAVAPQPTLAYRGPAVSVTRSHSVHREHTVVSHRGFRRGPGFFARITFRPQGRCGFRGCR